MQQTLAWSGPWYQVSFSCTAIISCALSHRLSAAAGCPAGLPDGMDTLPRALKRLGYRTHMAGKHHLGHAQWKQTPSGIGFDEFVGCYM